MQRVQGLDQDIWNQSTSESTRALTDVDLAKLKSQDGRPVQKFRAQKFLGESRKHWDLFYKRNADRFFKDRHWTQREFDELSGGVTSDEYVLLEVGCGVGNFVFPLLEADPRVFAFACDFSPRAIELVKQNHLYSEDRIRAFEADITSENGLEGFMSGSKAQVISLVFVLSAVNPTQHARVFANLRQVLSPDGGKILFRDYAENDMAMVRFGPGTKVSDRLYLRQDGTSSYFFKEEELRRLAEDAGLKIDKLEFVHRKTVNKKEGVDVPRVFLQAVFTY